MLKRISKGERKKERSALDVSLNLVTMEKGKPCTSSIPLLFVDMQKPKHKHLATLKLRKVVVVQYILPRYVITTSMAAYMSETGKKVI